MSQELKNNDTSKRAAWNPEQPYNDLPPLPPDADLETTAILRQLVKSRAALQGLNQATLLIPNPGILINTLPLLEAQASSEIENVVTTADSLFQHVSAEKVSDPATKEALRYRQAILEGYSGLRTRPITTRTAEELCSRIKDAEMSIRRVPGTKLSNTSTGKIIYTPPESEQLIRTLLANWEEFLHQSGELDPLIRMAVSHYQFEAIHPFTDGNGRTGRVLNSLYMVEQKLLSLPVLYLSQYIIAHKAEYYRLLLDVTSAGTWEPWILFMLRAVEETSDFTTAKIAAIRRLAEHTFDYVKANLPKIYSHELVDAVFEQPYCRIGNLVDRNIAGRQAASRYLKALAAVGVLREQAVGREKLFVQPRLLKLLTQDSNEFEPY
jgi:Fic family protein